MSEDLTPDERTALEQRLDLHREALAEILDGITEEEARRRLVPSKTTLLGLVKHATFVEKVWFTEALLGRPRTTLGLPADADNSFDLDGADTVESVRATYVSAVQEARANAAAFALDDVVTGNPRRPRVSLRWIYVHCISELAQHCGHADILREQIVASRD